MRISRIAAGLLVVAAVISPLVGCGGDDNKNGNGNNNVLDVRDGYWRIVTVATQTGDAEICVGSETSVDTSLVCDVDFSDVDQIPYDLTCDVTSDASTFSFSCGGSLVISPCTVLFTYAGNGTYGETSLHFTASARFSVSGPDNPCLQYADPCTTLVTVDGSWVSADTSGACATAKPATIEGFVREGVARVLGAE